MVETFGKGSHKHTHTHTHRSAHINTHTLRRTHTRALACFEGKKGKMTSSSSCEANETDEGGGENAGRNRTLLHKTRCGSPPGPVTTSCVCAAAHTPEFLRVNRLHNASSKGVRSSLRTCGVTVCRKKRALRHHAALRLLKICNTSHSKEVMSEIFL